MQSKYAKTLLAATSLASVVVLTPSASAQQAAKDTAAASPEIVVTGSRVPRRETEGVSPVAVTTGDQIKLLRATTVEDFTRNLPQLAGGSNSTSVSGDAHGAQTLDLRNLGENRTLVLINGTRAVPFSFRNSVDVSSIPAALLKRVDVLTGGAAAVYGADAVAGVVNFVMDDDFTGLRASAGAKAVNGGGSEYTANLTYGGSLGSRGHFTAYVEYTQRDALYAGARPFALANSTPIAGAGGNFTDVASGRTFAFTPTGQYTTTPQTTDYTAQFLLAEPLKRINADLFYNYHLTDAVELYGRAMFSNVRTVESSIIGSQPLVIDETVGISQTNPYLTPQIRSNLTFVNGVAQVHVNRSLSEVGPLTDNTNRDTYQLQAGLRGPLLPGVKWDAYIQYGHVSEHTIQNQGFNSTDLQSIVNSVNIFGAGDSRLQALSSPFVQSNRQRSLFNAAINLAGTSEALFSLPAGPIGFAVGYEYRDDKGTDYEDGADQFQGNLRSHEAYGEISIPLIHNAPLIKSLQLEGAYRISNYTRTGSNGSGTIGTFPTSKIGLIWELFNDLSLRGSFQKVVRVPNFGELDGSIDSLPFSKLRTVARLMPRYTGDPCALGTGNAAQCAALGYKGSYDSLDPANLVGRYYYGGNPDIKPEKGNTFTLGAVIKPSFIPGFYGTVDYYRISLNGATGVIQPVAALTNCYITDPVASNPLCQLVTRDPTSGRILNAYVNDQNLGSIKERGLDLNFHYTHAVPLGLPGKQFSIGYQANIVTSYTIQENATVAPIECKGTYGLTCSSDGLSVVAASYKHYVTFDWKFDKLLTQIAWQHIGSLHDSTPNSTGTIPAYDYFNLAVSAKLTDKVTFNFGIDNLFNKAPPTPINPILFNTYPDTYDVLGRRFGATITFRN